MIGNVKSVKTGTSQEELGATVVTRRNKKSNIPNLEGLEVKRVGKGRSQDSIKKKEIG